MKLMGYNINHIIVQIQGKKMMRAVMILIVVIYCLCRYFVVVFVASIVEHFSIVNTADLGSLITRRRSQTK